MNISNGLCVLFLNVYMVGAAGKVKAIGYVYVQNITE